MRSAVKHSQHRDGLAFFEAVVLSELRSELAEDVLGVLGMTEALGGAGLRFEPFPDASLRSRVRFRSFTATLRPSRRSRAAHNSYRAS